MHNVSKGFGVYAASVAAILMAGCGKPPEGTNVQVSTYGGAYVTGRADAVTVALSGQHVTGVFDSWISEPNVYDVGSATNFDVITQSPDADGINGAVDVSNLQMPANWDGTWYGDPSFCVNQSNISQHWSVPYTATFDLEPLYPTGGFMPFICYSNDPTHPNFVPTHVVPQFVLDDAIPSSIWFAALDQIPSGGTVTLDTYDLSLNHDSTVTASSVAADGSSATFSYPTGPNNAPLTAGTYIAAMSNQFGTDPTTIHGFEPFYIAHDDTSYTGAYGVAVAIPKETYRRTTFYPEGGHLCGIPTTTSGTLGGTAFPLVTLLTQGKLTLGNSSNTVAVGASPTVVLAFHDLTTTTSTPDPLCGSYGGGATYTYTGAQSALVVNTGSNSISIVKIGQATYPTGTVAVGNQPVAAAINPGETLAYIANYADGTVSEVDLSALTVNRSLSVMSHPTSLTFDSAGNLWVGGQGAVSEVNIGSWSISSTFPVDGTINGMSYDATSNVLVQTILQNGSVTAPSGGGTLTAQVHYSVFGSSSYSTQNVLNVATGSSTTSQTFADNASYGTSSIASYLAFPAQTAVVPPVYTSTSGDLTATVTGTSFTVSVVGTGQILIQGQLPYPARGVAISSSMVYFTMPDSNSLVSLPVLLP